MWNMKCLIVPVMIGATGGVKKGFKELLDDVPGKHSLDSLQKSALLGTSHIVRKVLRSETWSLSGGGHHWFKRSVREKRGKEIITTRTTTTTLPSHITCLACEGSHVCHMPVKHLSCPSVKFLELICMSLEVICWMMDCLSYQLCKSDSLLQPSWFSYGLYSQNMYHLQSSSFSGNISRVIFSVLTFLVRWRVSADAHMAVWFLLSCAKCMSFHQGREISFPRLGT